ncbi:MAG: hypothetical protein JO084_01660 [Bradyrhizobiaceae bacterium]|nr:hypothetical protein [Hyphomicrobiales bacterium]MBV9426416.1 hypothetical protein [Bradyrhizobiaceae bacterium]
MGLFRKRYPAHLIPIHHDNAANRDWIILLEASTIIGASPERLRVARTTQERKIVTKYRFLRPRLFLAMEGYDPRIHAVYFCPQLYKYDHDNKLVPLQGEEIGRFVAQALQNRTAVRRPWYEPTESLPTEPLIDEMVKEFDTLVVEAPEPRPVLAPPIERRHEGNGSENLSTARN